MNGLVDPRHGEDWLLVHVLTSVTINTKVPPSSNTNAATQRTKGFGGQKSNRGVVKRIKLHHYNMGDVQLMGNMFSDAILNCFLPIGCTCKEYLHSLLPQNIQL